MRPLQKFSTEYLEECRRMSTEEILVFLENFRILHAERTEASKSRLISIKVPEPLLEAFKTRSRLSGVPYQTQIKKLMKAWLE
jgi:predicted DNA binding CopG/RHH family protein